MNSIAQLSVLLMVSVPAWIRSPSTPFHQKRKQLNFPSFFKKKYQLQIYLDIELPVPPVEAGAGVVGVLQHLLQVQVGEVARGILL